MTTESITEFATFFATVDALMALDMEKHGLFFQLSSLDMKTEEFTLDYKTETGRFNAIGHIYECDNGRYRVAVHRDDWHPAVWNGPYTSRNATADTDALTEFAASIRRELSNSN